jgi:hypothetical protein
MNDNDSKIEKDNTKDAMEVTVLKESVRTKNEELDLLKDEVSVFNEKNSTIAIR